jgi:hypothetical protein
MTRKLSLLFVLTMFTALLFSLSPVSVISSGNQELNLVFRAPMLEIDSQTIGGEDFQILKMAESSQPADMGSPNLPIYSGSIILPPAGSYTLHVNSVKSRTISGIRPVPVYDDILGKSIPALDPQKYYDYIPKALVEPGEIAILRDFRILQFSVNPLEWNSGNEELTIHEELNISIQFNSEKSSNELPAYSGYSPAFRRIYEANLLNFEDYRNLNSEDTYGRVLFIYPSGSSPVYMAQLNAFIEWKRMKGHEVLAVSTQVAGNNTNTIKNYIQSQFNDPDTRPDYVVFVGDTPQIPTFFETMSGYGGEGDYPYTFLAGDDLLGDVFIGRISVETVDQLAVVLEKTYRYEREIANDPDSAEWLNRILLIGDPSSSGISCVYNSKYIKELAETVNPEYEFIENYSGGYSNTINSGINQGVNFFSYRGYIGMSGWSPSASLSNSPKFPHAVILTCGTGNFGSSYGTGTNEAFIRLGTSASPAGAVTAIGMATSGTHTMFNNTLNAAIFNGIFAYNMRSMGEALLNGRIYIREVYGATHSNQANYFAHWCNLMGDPTMEVFVGIPTSLQINAPASIVSGSKILDLSITDSDGNPIPNASVTAYNNNSGQVSARGYSDESGNISLFISEGIQDGYSITAAKNDHKPAETFISPTITGLVYEDKILYEDGTNGSVGNGDGFATAGETAALELSIKNLADFDISSISGTVSSSDPYINLLTDTISFPDAAINQSVVADNMVLFEINDNIPNNHDVRLVLSLSENHSYEYEIPIHQVTYNASLEVESYQIMAGGNNVLDPTETGTLNLSIRNSSISSINNVSAELFSLNDLVVVEDADAFIGSVPAGYLANTLDGFGLFARSLLIPGMQIPFRVRFTNGTDFEQDAFFTMTVGSVGENTPMGPDSYGYFIYDMSDTQYSDCPSYDWIEINPGLGGAGTKLTALNDSGTPSDEGDQTSSTSFTTVDLPFSFPFYGIAYDQITVCTNGFIGMGFTENGEFRNSRLPGGLGPSPMIAAFWDDLILLNDSGVYKYYDAQNHMFIIEYDKLRNGYNRTSLETFQVIFYDPLYHPTSFGDGKIKIQYKDFNNVDTGGGGYTPVHGNYCTIGIKDHSNTRGLEYTYNNQYAPGAAPLSNNSALLITTVPVLHESPYLIVQDVIVTDPNGNYIAEPMETVELGIRLVNQGLNTAEDATVTASLNHPFAQLINSESSYPDIPGDNGAVNLDPITVYIDESCPNNSQIEVQLQVQNGDSEWNYPVSFIVKKPAISVSSYMINDAMSNGNGLVDPGESLDLIVNLSNNTEVNARNISANIMSVSPYVEFGSNSAIIDCIPAQSTMQVVYPITLSADTPVGNNVTFYISYLGDLLEVGTAQLIMSVGTTGMSEDFEGDNGYFEPSPYYSGWEWGESDYAGAHSGSKVWGTDLDDNFTLNANYNLTTQPVYIGANFMLEFWHRYDTGSVTAGGNVKISTNGGSVWQVLTPEGGYPESNIPPLAGPGYRGETDDWVLARIPLANYGNQMVQFRFSFASGSSGVPAQGWYIDDVRTSGYLAYAGKIHGTVSSSDPEIDFSEIYVHNADHISTVPNAEGEYALYLPMHSQEVSVSGEGYYSEFPVLLQPSLENPVINQDFYIGWLTPVNSISRSIEEGVLTLSWDPPIEPEYEVYSYQLYRRFGAGAFELVSEAAEPGYTELLPSPGHYHFYLKVMYPEGLSRSSETLEFSWGGVDNEDDLQNPALTTLKGNFPNPFNPETTISFYLADKSALKLSIYNLKGQKVNDLYSGTMPAGDHTIIWNGRDAKGNPVSSGIYLMRLSTEQGNFTRKMMLMK